MWSVSRRLGFLKGLRRRSSPKQEQEGEDSGGGGGEGGGERMGDISWTAKGQVWGQVEQRGRGGQRVAAVGSQDFD